VGHGGNAGDRREITHRVVGAILDQALVGGVRLVGAEHERMAVGLGTRHRVGADDAGSAGTVFNHDRLVEVTRALLCDQTRQGIDGAAGRIGHDDGDGSTGKALRASGDGQTERGEAGKNGTAIEHGCPGAGGERNSMSPQMPGQRR
jgi:hypothetical protein